jgi:hypothetical protein
MCLIFLTYVTNRSGYITACVWCQPVRVYDLKLGSVWARGGMVKLTDLPVIGNLLQNDVPCGGRGLILSSSYTGRFPSRAIAPSEGWTTQNADSSVAQAGYELRCPSFVVCGRHVLVLDRSS